MKKSQPELICSVLTARAPAGIAAVLLRGPGARSVLAAVFRRVKGRPLPDPDRAACGALWRGDAPVDEVVVIARPDSAEETFEVCCHGGSAAAAAVAALFVESGAVEVPWTDLLPRRSLQRDLAEALLAAAGRCQALALAGMLSGSLAAAFREMLAAVAHLDAGRSARRGAAAVRADARVDLAELDRLAASFEIGRFLAAPPVAVIAGACNAGKSTLFNALLGEPRALVSPYPGTTRDPVAAVAIFGGFPVVLVDTAGCRPEDSSRLHRRSAAAALRRIAAADIEIRVADASAQDEGSAGDLPGRLEGGSRVLAVLNKCDLLPGSGRAVAESSAGAEAGGPVRISALKGEGLDQLVWAVSTRLGLPRLAAHSGPLLFKSSQLRLVQEVIAALEAREARPALVRKLRRYLPSGAALV